MIDFDHVLDAINDVTQKSEKYVIGNHFTEQSRLSLADWATFLSFKEDKTLQSDIENYITKYRSELDIPSKQYVSSLRTYKLFAWYVQFRLIIGDIIFYI